MPASSRLSAALLRENERPADGAAVKPSEMKPGEGEKALLRRQSSGASDGVLRQAFSRGVASGEQLLGYPGSRRRHADWVYTDDEFRSGPPPTRPRLDDPSQDQENRPPSERGAEIGRHGRTGSLSERALGELPVELPEDYEEHSHSEVEWDDDDPAEELGSLALSLEERIQLNEGGRYEFQIYEDP